MAAFHCASPPERQSKLVPLIAAFTTYENFYKIPEEGKEGDSSESEDEVRGNGIHQLSVPLRETMGCSALCRLCYR